MVYAGLGYQAKWNIQGKAVLIKQKSVTGAYIRKAKKADREFNPGITPGPVEIALRVFGSVKGLAAGPSGEVSPHFEEFVKRLAEKAAMGKGDGKLWGLVVKERQQRHMFKAFVGRSVFYSPGLWHSSCLTGST